MPRFVCLDAELFSYLRASPIQKAPGHLKPFNQKADPLREIARLILQKSI